MPAFPWLFEDEVNSARTADKMAALRKVGVPYTDEDISGAAAAVEGKKEIEALVAYLQQLGTLLQTRR
jgi:cytochrome c oxidase cbb3-type subunit 2